MLYNFKAEVYTKNVGDYYPKADMVEKIILDQNYRSSNMILKGANSVINNNSNREKKSLKGQNEGSFSDVVINEAKDLVAEGYKKIQNAVGFNSFNCVGILFFRNSFRSFKKYRNRCLYS